MGIQAGLDVLAIGTPRANWNCRCRAGVRTSPGHAVTDRHAPLLNDWLPRRRVSRFVRAGVAWLPLTSRPFVSALAFRRHFEKARVR